MVLAQSLQLLHLGIQVLLLEVACQQLRLEPLILIDESAQFDLELLHDLIHLRFLYRFQFVLLLLQLAHHLSTNASGVQSGQLVFLEFSLQCLVQLFDIAV